MGPATVERLPVDESNTEWCKLLLEGKKNQYMHMLVECT